MCGWCTTDDFICEETYEESECGELTNIRGKYFANYDLISERIRTYVREKIKSVLTQYDIVNIPYVCVPYIASAKTIQFSCKFVDIEGKTVHLLLDKPLIEVTKELLKEKNSNRHFHVFHGSGYTPKGYYFRSGWILSFIQNSW